jgi:hypothetical protein
MAEPITKEWLESNGYRPDQLLGYTKDLAHGPDGVTLTVAVGNYPWNSPAVTVLVAGFGVVTRNLTREHIEAIERVFEGAEIDHPDVAEFDEDSDDVT